MKTAIKNYIEYLSKEHGLQISLHGSGLLPRLDFSPPTIRTNAYIVCLLKQARNAGKGVFAAKNALWINYLAKGLFSEAVTQASANSFSRYTPSKRK